MRAMFSVRKYSEPPMMPSPKKVSSSFQSSAQSLLCETASIQQYAMMKRHTKMSAGMSPELRRTLLLTNVVPQIVTTKRAPK